MRPGPRTLRTFGIFKAFRTKDFQDASDAEPPWDSLPWRPPRAMVLTCATCMPRFRLARRHLASAKAATIEDEAGTRVGCLVARCVDESNQELELKVEVAEATETAIWLEIGGFAPANATSRESARRLFDRGASLTASSEQQILVGQNASASYKRKV